MLGMEALVAVADAGWATLGGLVINAAGSAIATFAVLRWRANRADKDLEDLKRADAIHVQQIAQLQIDRSACELRTSQNYVNRQEYVRLMGAQTGFEREVVSRLDGLRESIDNKMGDLHERITDLATEFARAQGQQEKSK